MEVNLIEITICYRLGLSHAAAIAILAFIVNGDRKGERIINGCITCCYCSALIFSWIILIWLSRIPWV